MLIKKLNISPDDMYFTVSEIAANIGGSTANL